MARNKKNKKRSNKQPTQLSPEKYIRQKARNLPLFRCYINDDWESSGMGNVLVIRVHKNGNYTIGYYLVDLKCLGVERTSFMFNEPESLLDTLINNPVGMAFSEIDYILGHNIIFGGIKFAESYGIKPHRLWSVTEYILEPDDDSIPILDIEFGENGKPHFIAGPDDDDHRINQVLNTLNTSAGPGHFYFTASDESMDEDDFDEDDFDEDDFDEDELLDFDEETIEEILENLQEMGLLGDPNGTLLQSFTTLSNLYMIAFPEEVPKILPTDIQFDVRIDDESYDIQPEDEEYISHTIRSIYRKSKKVQNSTLAKLQNRYVDSSEGLLMIYCTWQGIFEHEPKIIKSLIEEKYPDHVGYTLLQSYQSSATGNPDKGWDLLRKSLKIQEAFPQHEFFKPYEYEWFLIASIAYFCAIDDISTAISYTTVLINEIEDFEMSYPLADEAIEMMFDKLEEKFDEIDSPDTFDTPDTLKNRNNMKKL